MLKLPHNCTHLTYWQSNAQNSPSQASVNFQMFKLDLEKAQEPEIKLPRSVGSSKKQEFQKNIYFCFIDYTKAFDCVNHTNCGKFFKRWEYQTTWPEKSICRVQFSLVAQLCLTLCYPMNHSTPGLPVHHQLLEFTQTHVHWVGDAIQPSHPLSSPSPPAPNPSQHQSFFQWVNSLHEVAKVLQFQL